MRKYCIPHFLLSGSGFFFLFIVYQMRKDCHKDFMNPRETLLKQDLFQRHHSETVAESKLILVEFLYSNEVQILQKILLMPTNWATSSIQFNSADNL